MSVLFAACFQAAAELHALVLAADLAAAPSGAAEIWVIAPDGEWRRGLLAGVQKGGPHLLLGFPAFANAEGALFHIVALDGQGGLAAARAAQVGAPIAIAMPRLSAPLPATPARGIFLLPAARPAADFPVVSDYGGHWRDQFGAYLSGWVHCGPLVPRRLFLRLGDGERELALTPFPEVTHFHPEAAAPMRWGGSVPGPAGAPLQLRVVTDAGERLVEVALPPRLAEPPPAPPVVPELVWRFVRLVNERRLRVLEIGARLVAPGAKRWRDEMRGAASYIGLDIHPDDNVDLVGDAHALSSLVPPGSLDAVWSYDVIEHLRMPWLVAAEINRVLRPGGLVFIAAPHTWPLHEMPADYWRYSDEGLRVLFGAEFGFEVIEAGMVEPMRIIPPHRQHPYDEMPLHPGYGHALALARKVAELPAPAGLEAAQRAAVGESGRLYPAGEAERLAAARKQGPSFS